jgi:hypothetical protein
LVEFRSGLARRLFTPDMEGVLSMLLWIAIGLGIYRKSAR